MKLIFSFLFVIVFSSAHAQNKVDTLDESGWPKQDAAYILGKENGFKEYKAGGAFFSGLIFPMAAGFGVSTSQPKMVGVAFGSVLALSISLDLITQIPIETKNPNLQYIKGYKSAVRYKRIGNGLLGGIVGVVVMSLAFALF